MLRVGLSAREGHWQFILRQAQWPQTWREVMTETMRLAHGFAVFAAA
jgi:hypothetical protein